MRHKSEVPTDQQIRISQFKLLPGDLVLIKVKNTFYHGRVTEVGAGSAEYTLWLQRGRKGPKPKVGMITWHESGRKEAEQWIRGQAGHASDQPLTLQRSMWAVVEFAAARASNAMKHSLKKRKKRLYTYDIEHMLKTDRLRIVIK
ncbi:MAG: hypothetical protein A3I44_04785 [Candidatus Sungbacteria bacterium RIFCSPLOWO2_02_FULL_51_17]|uniref:Uncharacterized protein n=1 Tax=Candidatus Sungbacteria bacterium RIFCSPHIGHO2_02_FULL_51_29 TaxID=1802273 RepID=A0A1G2KPA8_9BACT|nr:MAG: hypothetical protein A2676_01585 [Candidatus Sungbacteria bacterium RIFCSPHIGHO2_01_FULL_51_22]OHA01240.1 MAG: hypothetical protein A3C16_02825 [Candidatus Sungbacteria bacterium RIFCSPHIGHO2_02_FULL_51_29]OHA05863.1 MAG: hypothetical protein A3B29_01845 [Candidatus Sungbacteria bacterium RIFCSPLOWO2_01_FULL_51_34]OHA11349.1 MAG: hypothetical protein A3I44_04785 [Candidatus Sungbacteria bacterium RIFCSPLOWO2_02_FULL_51_17]